MLVERHDELSVLREAFAETLDGKGRVVLINGDLATGKTELLQTFTESVAEQGALVLTATAARAERAMRMGVMWQLFRSTALSAGTLDRVSRLIEAEPQATEERDLDPGTMQLTDARVVHGVSSVLLDLAADTPVVIAIDDLQFVDGGSLQVLLYLRRRMRSRRLLLALTEWQRPGRPGSFLRAEVSRQPSHRLTLAPLSEAGVTELVAHRLGQRTGSRFASACYALSGGNPLLLRALIDDHARAAEPVRDRPVPGGAFRQAVLDCLHRWDPDLLAVASGLAVLADAASPDRVAELLAMQPQSVSQLFDVLAAAGIVRGERFRHSEIAATVLEGMPPEEVARLHVRAAELLYRHGADAMEVARHVVAGDAAPGPWAVRVLRHAADQAVVDDAPLAVRCLELAMRACDEERDRVALRAALVRVAWRVNPSVAMRHLSPLHGAVNAGELTWRDAVPVTRHLLWQGDLCAAAAQLQAVHAAAGPPDARTTAELRLACEWIYGSLRDRVPQDVHALLCPSATSANPWVRTAMLNSLWSGRAGRDVVNSAEHILQGCLGDVMPEVGATALLALDDADRHERAMFWCNTLFDEAVRRQATTWQAVLGCVHADLAWRRGDLVTADARAATALSLLPTQSWGVLIGFPLSILIQVNTAMGRHDAAAELLDRALPEAMFATSFGPRYLHASGHFNLACGRPLAALDDFERCAAWLRGQDRDVPAVVPWRSDLAQTLLRLGRRKEARDLVAEQLNRTGPAGGSRTRAVALRVLAACTDVKDRAPLLREAIQCLERCGDRLELARALADLSQLQRELGQLGDARLTLRKVEQLAKACNAEVLPDQRGRPIPDRPVREDPTPTGPATLSDAERKVAELAADGHTNREIGRKLYITVSTVEQHLTRIYKKLNVTRRTDLAPELSRQDSVESRLAVSHMGP
ncbi:MAG TPA: AAA family ATPase [Actinophytocola sp.]|uniref:AAA family ATPase n=1 Tax=Actinophytocola sp. TaxID=1872138 RepID=UPI002DBEB812|nr:AAA family ATPase [Actinophytocola sp.]HEU5473407.1 AAA family ATPase [Actinophytocola sp.]